MDLGMGLELSLRPVLSANMLQSLDVLSLSQEELNSYIEKEFLENPVIEITEVVRQRYVPLQQVPEFDLRDSGFKDQLFRRSLHEELLMLDISETDRLCLGFLVEMLDDRGFLPEDIEEICVEKGISVQLMKHCILLLQKFDPPGIGALSVKECLMIQAERCGEVSDRIRDIASKIIRDHLQELAKNHLEKIADDLWISREEAELAASFIKTLSPVPSGVYMGSSSEYILPDITVTYTDGKLSAVIHSCGTDISINNEYLAMNNGMKDPQLAEYLDDRIKRAKWMIRCIEARKEMLTRLTELILTRHSEFFLTGCSEMDYFPQNEAASILGVNKSTISRAVRSKYLQCRWGMYPLSFFFSRGSKRFSDPRCRSRDQIWSAIKKIIEKEEKRNPLSDRSIAEKLKVMELPISRRTVAKYREQMNIPDAAGRRII